MMECFKLEHALCKSGLVICLVVNSTRERRKRERHDKIQLIILIN